MKRCYKNACYIACLILSFLVEGCISLYTGRATFIDTGGAIANIGQKQAKLRPEEQPVTKGGVDIFQFRYRTWKKGDSYILQLPVCYVPARYPVLVHFSGWDWRKKTLDGQYPERYRDAEVVQYPVEYFYAELTEEQYEQMWTVDKRIKQNRQSILRDVRILTPADVDLSNAVLLSDRCGKPYPMLRLWNNCENLPAPRRTWYNRCLMPLSWAAEAVDIPLSIIATPIGWVVDAIYEPLNN